MARRDEKLSSCGDFAVNYILPTNDNKNMNKFNKLFSLHMNLHKWWNGKIENSFHRLSVIDRDRTGHENQNNNLDRYILKMAHYFTAKWKKNSLRFWMLKLHVVLAIIFTWFLAFLPNIISMCRKKEDWMMLRLITKRNFNASFPFMVPNCCYSECVKWKMKRTFKEVLNIVFIWMDTWNIMNKKMWRSALMEQAWLFFLKESPNKRIIIVIKQE